MSRRLTILPLSAVLVLMVVAGGSYYRLVVWPRDNFLKVCENSDSTDDEIRETTHRLIAWNVSHDGFMALELIGDATSVPLLIRSLGRAPEEDRKSGHVECTWGHCKDALVAITREDFGFDVEKWKTWHRNQPSEVGSYDGG
jgi:hypothetical protein